ncbi:MAG: hypothetical protein UIC64_04905 [Agathobacter sp.]|nr:hypothetical protein [Agathobacter sp.]
MIEFIKQYLTGERWEALCNSCYRMRYQEEGYQEIPAQYRGDGGIEGFTKTGIVYQCYCPEKEYSDDELYEHMRKKMTKDIAKFISTDYEKVLKGLGVQNVHQWHFVVPQNKDRRILEHAEKKRKEVIEYLNAHKEQCSYIADDFTIVVKIADDFKVEISRIIRNDLGYKLDFTVLRDKKVDWTKCDNEKVNNVKRKIKAVMNGIDDDDEDYIDMVNTYMESYVIGIELREKLRTEQVDIYEQIINLEDTYKRQVAIKTKTNTDSSINQRLFMEILDDFQSVLEKEFPYITRSSIGELKDDMISSWLADCSMQFKSR